MTKHGADAVMVTLPGLRQRKTQKKENGFDQKLVGWKTKRAPQKLEVRKKRLLVFASKFKCFSFLRARARGMEGA